MNNKQLAVSKMNQLEESVWIYDKLYGYEVSSYRYKIIEHQHPHWFTIPNVFQSASELEKLADRLVELGLTVIETTGNVVLLDKGFEVSIEYSMQNIIGSHESKTRPEAWFNAFTEAKPHIERLL